MKLGCKEVARGLGWEQPLAETEALYAQLLSDLSVVPTRQTRFEPERSTRRDLSS